MSNGTNSPARQRIFSLLDANSFVEIGAGVTARSTDFNMSEKKAPSDGVITGYGLADGNLVYVYSQDASVLKGSLGEMHARKITNLYSLAVKTGAPVVGLVDCAGMRLEEATDGLAAFGEIYQAQVNASGLVPQITGIFGMCGGGMALIPSLTDFTFMEETKASLFVTPPNAVKGEYESDSVSASAKCQAEEAGSVDGIGSEADILARMRDLLALLPENNEDSVCIPCSDDLNRTSADLGACAADPALILQRIADDNYYFELRGSFGRDMLTAFIRLNGSTVGVVANRSVIYGEDGSVKEELGRQASSRGLRKAAEFVTFCDAFSIPVVSFTNISGFKPAKCASSGLAAAAAKLTYAFTNATTPKINVITEEAFGSAYLVMNSKTTGADLVFAWEGAKIGMMDALSAAKIMYEGEPASLIQEKAAEYDGLQNSLASAAARGYVDNVIPAEETRKYLIGSLDMLYTKRESRPNKKHGTV